MQSLHPEWVYVTTSRSTASLFILLRTLLHIFALFKNSTLLFLGDSELFGKNTRGGGGDLLSMSISGVFDSQKEEKSLGDGPSIPKISFNDY
jgi:hypothetical protein